MWSLRRPRYHTKCRSIRSPTIGQRRSKEIAEPARNGRGLRWGVRLSPRGTYSQPAHTRRNQRMRSRRRLRETEGISLSPPVRSGGAHITTLSPTRVREGLNRVRHVGTALGLTGGLGVPL